MSPTEARAPANDHLCSGGEDCLVPHTGMSKGIKSAGSDERLGHKGLIEEDDDDMEMKIFAPTIIQKDGQNLLDRSNRSSNDPIQKKSHGSSANNGHGSGGHPSGGSGGQNSRGSGGSQPLFGNNQ